MYGQKIRQEILTSSVFYYTYGYPRVKIFSCSLAFDSRIAVIFPELPRVSGKFNDAIIWLQSCFTKSFVYTIQLIHLYLHMIRSKKKVFIFF